MIRNAEHNALEGAGRDVRQDTNCGIYSGRLK